MKAVRGLDTLALPAAVVVGAFGLLAIALVSMPLRVVAVIALLAVLAAATFKAVVSWDILLKCVLVVIMFIPIRRYTLPVNLGISLEPYRILVGLLLLAWLASLLVDRRVRLRRSGFEMQLVGYLAAIGLSVAANLGHISSGGLGTDVAKQITFVLSFVLLLFLISSVVSSRAQVDDLLRVLVLSGTVVAISTAVERNTGYNVFNHLDSAIPFLRPDGVLSDDFRNGNFRALGSAQHPIAMGAAFVMLIPIALYLARTRARLRWGAVVATLCTGAVSTFSRTSVLMLIVVAIVFLILRPRETRRYWPALLPVLVVIHFAVPGTLGQLKDSFFPQGGLIADQKTSQGTVGQGRIADIGPALREYSQTPLYGEGFGSREIQFNANGVPVGGAQILDDQWLDVLLETGALGVATLLVLFVVAVKRIGGAARRDRGERGWGLVSITASLCAFGVGMLTYDAFAFIQVTFLFFILLGLGGVLLRTAPSAVGEPAEGVARARRGRGLPAAELGL
jgi:polysaccharide biosynthesis protein PslJ